MSSNGLCGYFLYWPTKTGMKVLKEHVKKIKACFEPNSVKLIKQLAGDEAPKESNQKVLDALSELGVSTGDYKNHFGFNDDEEKWSPEQMEEFLEQIKSDAEGLTDEVDFNASDTNSSTIKVNGCTVEVFFAGSESWGDEPESGGYNLFKKMCFLGVYDALRKSIPWEQQPKRKAKR